jgi:hypothetical protein
MLGNSGKRCLFTDSVSELYGQRLYMYEKESFHCSLYRQATGHVLTQVPKFIDVGSGILENILY